jgi:vitamin B12 transporter
MKCGPAGKQAGTVGSCESSMSYLLRPFVATSVARCGALLPVSLLSIAFGAAAQGQSAGTSTAQSVVVTGTRTPQRIDQALAEVTVIVRTSIDAATGRTLPELLAREAGVQFSSNGGLGKSSSVSLRGLEARHTLLLIDGVRYGSATLGTPAWENLPLDAIERIEIVRGPLSGLYGSDAVGGVIQIFTRRGAEGFATDVSIKAGSHGHAEAAAGLHFGWGAFDGAVRVQHLRQDGFSATNDRAPFGNFNADDDGFGQSSLTARAGARLGEWRTEVSLLASHGRTRYDDGPGADAQAALRSQVLSATFGGPIAGTWRNTLRLARSEDEFETLATASAFASLGTIGTVQRQLGWEHTIATPLGEVLGLVERIEQSVRRPGMPFAVSERSIDAVAVGLNGRAGPHGWQANVRHDRNSQFGSQATGSIAYGGDLGPGLRFGASYGTSFVAPSFNQLYFPGFGNPDLLPEEGRQSEFNLRWDFGVGAARLAYFDNRIRGYISSGPLPINIPRTRIDGISGSVEGTADAWTFGASLDLLDPRNDTAGAANFGKRLPRRVAQSARVSADRRGGALTFGGTLAAHGDRFDNAANTTRLPGYATLDLRAAWKLAADWQLAAALNNALGKRYETVFGYNQPGREAFVSLRWAPR